MSERPNVVLGALIGTAAALAVLLASGLFALGGHGIAHVAVAVASTFSTCIFFLIEFRHLPVASVAALLLACASLAALAWTIRLFLVQSQLLRALPLEPVADDHLLEAAREAHVAVFVTPASRPAALCIGLLKPRVILTDGLLSRLSNEERAAAVYHELHHAQSRAPLKCLIARIAASTFFWLPLLADLLDRYLLVKELAADRLAATRTSRDALAGALHEVAETPTPIGAVGLAEHAAIRVDRLFDARAALPPLWRRRRLGLSAAAVATVAAVVLAPDGVAIRTSGRLQSILAESAHSSVGVCLGAVFNALLFLTLVFGVSRAIVSRRRAQDR